MFFFRSHEVNRRMVWKSGFPNLPRCQQISARSDRFSSTARSVMQPARRDNDVAEHVRITGVFEFSRCELRIAPIAAQGVMACRERARLDLGIGCDHRQKPGGLQAI
jgi:hypothetical protein